MVLVRLTTALVIVQICLFLGILTLELKREEAVGLAEAIDLELVASEIVNVSRIRPATLFGRGKTDDIAAFVKANKIDVAIVDHELTDF